MEYIQGENITFYIPFLDNLSAPICTGVSGATVSVYHFDTSAIVMDINSGTMTQQNSPFQNIWYYNYSIPNNALTTNYNVVYTALFGGAVVQSTELYNVFPAASYFPTTAGQGSVATSGTVVDVSGNGISSTSIIVASGQNSYAYATSDVSGNYIAYLNPGTYLFSFFASGYYPTQTLQSVPSGTMWNNGVQVLQYSSQGSLIISDTFAYQTPNKTTYYLPNLKVSLFDKRDNEEVPPYGIAYTNVSGTFVMTADPGQYVMTVQGEFWNQNTQKNDRYNYTYDIEVNSVWSGSGASGTSSPINFNYLDTSKYNFLN